MGAKISSFLKRKQPNICESCLSGGNYGLDKTRLDKKYLLEAVKSDHDQCAEELIKTGLDLNSRDVIEAFWLSASKGKSNILDLLIKAGVDVNIRDTCSSTALMRASMSGHYLCVTSLLRAGAQTNVADSKGVTVLMHMVKGGFASCVKVLIESGADVNRADSEGTTALMIAASIGLRKPTRQWMDTPNAIFVNMHKTKEKTPTSEGHSKCVELLLEAGVDVNMSDVSGDTAIILAAYHGNAEGLKLLLSAGADVNSTNRYGEIPLVVCMKSWRNTLPCVMLLLEHGADVNFVSKHSDSPLTCAIEHRSYCSYDYILTLIEAGADVNVLRHRDGYTPLMLAVHDRDERYVRLLLRSGSKINILDKYGQNTWGFLDRREKLFTLLSAAGQRFFGRIPSWDNIKWLTHPELSLKHMCRETIRKHLLDLDPHTHLFSRVPKLGLPSLLQDYMLYNQTLDDNYNNYYASGAIMQLHWLCMK